MRKPKVVSLFSGAGGLDIGFKKAGFHTVFATDVWDIACNTLKANNMADEDICNDVRKINFDEVVNKYGEIDCVIGGPPCRHIVKLVIIWWEKRMDSMMKKQDLRFLNILELLKK